MSGQINWVELPAAGTAKARAFYRSLFGWGTGEFDSDYHVIQNGPAGAARTSKPSPAPAGSRPATTTRAPCSASTNPPRTADQPRVFLVPWWATFVRVER